MLIFRRGKVYQLRKRVPRRFQPVESRAMIEVSLHTDSESIARRKALDVWAEMVEAWEAKLAGNSADAEARFDGARELAQMRGFSYLPAAKVLALPEEEILKRLRAVPVRDGVPDRIEAAAILGRVPEPPITVSRALELYWELAKGKALGKSESQVRKWQNPIRQAPATSSPWWATRLLPRSPGMTCAPSATGGLTGWKPKT